MQVQVFKSYEGNHETYMALYHTIEKKKDEEMVIVVSTDEQQHSMAKETLKSYLLL